MSDAAQMPTTAKKSRMPPILPNLLGLAAALVADWLRPWPVAPYAYALGLGLALVVAVVLLSRACAAEFRRHGTTDDPRGESVALIDSGPFRYSRNPAYVAMALLHLAVGLLLNNVWALLSLLPAMLVVDRVVVRGEEAYLAERFGEEYVKYRSRVRRWL